MPRPGGERLGAKASPVDPRELGGELADDAQHGRGAVPEPTRADGRDGGAPPCVRIPIAHAAASSRLPPGPPVARSI